MIYLFPAGMKVLGLIVSIVLLGVSSAFAKCGPDKEDPSQRAEQAERAEPAIPRKPASTSPDEGKSNATDKDTAKASGGSEKQN